MCVGPIVSTPLSYGWSLTRFGFFGLMKLLRISGTIGKTTATTRKIATGPKDSSIDQTPEFDANEWGPERPIVAHRARGVQRGERGVTAGSVRAADRPKYIMPSEPADRPATRVTVARSEG